MSKFPNLKKKAQITVIKAIDKKIHLFIQLSNGNLVMFSTQEMTNAENLAQELREQL